MLQRKIKKLTKSFLETIVKYRVLVIVLVIGALLAACHQDACPGF